MRNKRLGTILLTGVMMLSMTGCGNDKAKKYDKYVELGEYKGIEYTLEVAEVTDEDIDAKLDSFVQGLTETEEVTDRAVKEGDTVNIDYVGTKDGEAFDGGTAQGSELEIGSGSFIEGFEDGLIGHEIGEEVSLDLKFPEPYENNPDLAGQDVNFKVTINSISVKKVPTLSDDLVKKNTEYETIEAYKESIRKDLEESNLESAKNQAKSDVFNKVVEAAKVTGYDQKEVDKLIDQEFKSFKETAESYQSYGYSYEDVLASNGYSSEDELKEGITEYVKNYLNQVMVLYCIADEEKITVTNDEVEEMVKEYMKNYSVETEEEVYDYFGEDYFEVSILSEKIMDFLMENAVEVEAADTEEDTTEAEDKTTEKADDKTEEKTTEKAEDKTEEKTTEKADNTEDKSESEEETEEKTEEKSDK